MLSACVECILNGQVDDIYAVPISITYEKLLEETIYANELIGAQKFKESLPNLVKNLHTITNQCYGTIIVNFLKPMSIKELLYRKEFDLQQPRLTLMPSYNFQLEKDELEAISAMAQTISVAISNGKIIMPISIICTLLLQSRKNNEAISMQALVDDIKFLQNLLASLDVPSSCMPDEDIDKTVFETFKLHSNLFACNWTDHKQHGVQNSIESMCLNDYLLLNKKLVFVRLQSDTGPRDVLKNAASYLRVCSYRNQLINHFIGYSVFIVSLLSTKTSLAALDLFSFFLELFNLEFVFSRFDTIKYFKTIAIYFESVNIIDNEFHVAANSSNSRLVQFLMHVVKPYLFNYFNIYKLIVEKRFEKFNSEKTFCLGLQACLIEHIRSNAHDMEISYELLSLNLIENSIRSLGGSFGVLSKVKVKDEKEASKSPLLYELNLQRLQDSLVARLASVCDTFGQFHSEPVRSLSSPSESAFEAYYNTKELTVVDTG
jgi:glycerone phosphate O-acyltransferase